MNDQNQESQKATIAGIRTSSCREREFEGDYVVRLEHESWAEPVDFSIVGGQALAVRLCVAAECAVKGIEATPRVYNRDENDLQMLVVIQSFIAADESPGVQFDFANFRIRMCPTSAVRLACRIAYASELARMKVAHEMIEDDLTEELIEAAYFQLMARATQCLVRGKIHELEGVNANEKQP